MHFARAASALAVLALTSLAGCAAFGEDENPTDLSTRAAVHLKGGANAEPSFVDNGLSLTAKGGLSGLGNADLVVNLSAVGQPISTCTNPAGATQPPGQNPAEVTLTGSQTISANEIKNGTVSFNLTTGAPAEILEGAPGCPNEQWTQRIVDVAFTSATISVVQGGGNVLTLSCTFSEPTANGAVSARNVTCQ